MKAVVAYVSAAVILGVLDFIWLSQMAPRLYRPLIGELMVDQPRWGPAIAFYVLYLFGLTVLITLPALREGGAGKAAWTGALFGLVAYATYDLTNQATLRIWPAQLTVIDMAWGTFITAMAATVAVLVTRMVTR